MCALCSLPENIGAESVAGKSSDFIHSLQALFLSTVRDHVIGHGCERP